MNFLGIGKTFHGEEGGGGRGGLAVIDPAHPVEFMRQGKSMRQAREAIHFLRQGARCRGYIKLRIVNSQRGYARVKRQQRVAFVVLADQLGGLKVRHALAHILGVTLKVCWQDIMRPKPRVGWRARSMTCGIFPPMPGGQLRPFRRLFWGFNIKA